MVGPARPWLQVRASYERALRVLRPRPRPRTTEPPSTPRTTWPGWCSAPTRPPSTTCGSRCSPRWPTCAPAAAEKLRDTLRAWLLHHGRREEVAAALFVHPQTVRYRMGQLRELYGDRLDDPDWVLRLTLALG